MTDAQKQLLAMCKPDVVLQANRVLFHGWPKPAEDNPLFYVAAQCESEGWLAHVRDDDFEQVVYRITPAGAAALAASS
jgi:hypothetical protein